MLKDRRRGNTNRAGNGNGLAEEMSRTTLFLTSTQNLNLDVLALRQGRSKGELLREAVAAYLRANDMNPDRRPVVEFSYS